MLRVPAEPVEAVSAVKLPDKLTSKSASPEPPMLVAVASRGEGQIELATNAYEVLRKYGVQAPER